MAWSRSCPSLGWLWELDTTWEREWTSLPHSLHSLSPLPSRLSFFRSWIWVPANRGVCSVWGSTHTAGVCWDHLYGFPPVTPVTSPPHLSLPPPPPPFPVPASGSALIILLWASDHNSCLDRCSGDENVRGERLKWGRERGASESSGGGYLITITNEEGSPYWRDSVL